MNGTVERDDEVEGHGAILSNVNETVERDDEVEGHATFAINLNETIEREGDAGHGQARDAGRPEAPRPPPTS